LFEEVGGWGRDGGSEFDWGTLSGYMYRTIKMKSLCATNKNTERKLV
jgi:hypothetical protein